MSTLKPGALRDLTRATLLISAEPGVLEVEVLKCFAWDQPSTHDLRLATSCKGDPLEELFGKKNKEGEAQGRISKPFPNQDKWLQA